jgi:DNA-binding CsgD family transcriptional regulator
MFYPEHPDRTLLRMPASHDFKDFLEEFVDDGWWRHDHRADRGWPKFHAGQTVLLEHDVASDDDRRTLPEYHELYNRYDMPWWAGLGFRVEGRQWAVPVLRSGGQGPFTREEADRMQHIVPHLRRMISMSEKLTLGRVATSLDMLDHMSVAALALDWRGRVVRTNQAAERLPGDDIRIVDGQLKATDRESDKRLQRLIAASVVSDATDLSRPCASVSVEPVPIRRVGRQPLVVETMPAHGLFGDVLCQARALVLITDLATPAPALPERIASVLGLTAAEGRLVAQLVEGKELADAAERLGISIHTARSQVKSVFVKTGTHRQAELVALAGRIGCRRRP